MKDYYAILGVRNNASAAEIRRVYRRLALQYHPDKNPSPEAEALFKEINEAYEVLGDPDKKIVYDRRLQNPFEEILEQAPPQPAHRDPRYRRGRPNTPQSGGKKVNPSHELMKRWLPYMLWVSKAGIILTSIFFVDYLLPHRERDETITYIYKTSVRRSAGYFRAETSSDEAIKVYPDDMLYFPKEGERVRVRYTFLGSIPVSVTDKTGFTIHLAYLYGRLIYFPLVLLVISVAAIIFRKRVDLCFNLCFFSGAMLIINAVFFYNA